MAIKKKNLSYYLNLNWSYTIEQETHNRKTYYIIRVNELPGVCTDAETIEEGVNHPSLKEGACWVTSKGNWLTRELTKGEF